MGVPMKKLVAATALCAALALSAGVATAGHRGHHSAARISAQAEQCLKGGWKVVVRSDRTAFSSQGGCTSYVAKGGTLSPSTQSMCEGALGTFSTTGPDLSGRDLSGRAIVWVCNGLMVASQAQLDSLVSACRGDGAARGYTAVGLFGPITTFPGDTINVTCAGYPPA